MTRARSAATAMMPTAMAVMPIALVANARLTSGEFDDDTQARGAFGHSRRRSQSACRRGPMPAAEARTTASASPRRAHDACKRCPISVVNAATDRPDYTPVPPLPVTRPGNYRNLLHLSPLFGRRRPGWDMIRPMAGLV